MNSVPNDRHDLADRERNWCSQWTKSGNSSNLEDRGGHSGKFQPSPSSRRELRKFTVPLRSFVSLHGRIAHEIMGPLLLERSTKHAAPLGSVAVVVFDI